MRLIRAFFRWLCRPGPPDPPRSTHYLCRCCGSWTGPDHCRFCGTPPFDCNCEQCKARLLSGLRVIEDPGQPW